VIRVKDLIPLILAAVVLATVMAAVLVVVRYRDRRPIRA
jgi:hypothetical protein